MWWITSLDNAAKFERTNLWQLIGASLLKWLWLRQCLYHDDYKCAPIFKQYCFFCSVVLLVNGKQTTLREYEKCLRCYFRFCIQLFYFSQTGKFFKNPKIARPDKFTCYQRMIMHIFTTKNMKINKRSQLLELFYGSLPVWKIL